jgi:pyrimidine-nucleoside phosphorylase
MDVINIIEKKKSGKSLSKEEIDFFVQGYSKGEIPDYQMSALLMAIWFRGMDKEEISNLTISMVHSGKIIDLSKIKGIKVDKHSSGGVADTVSLPLVALVAANGVPVAKMSGRGLGHTGGTIDKLESIPGFRVEIEIKEFIEIVNRVHGAIISQSEELVLADKKMYSLRDVTGTVDSIPLIASSIMSKKIASGSDAIVLDVKVGNGAFMQKIEDALILSKTMVDIGNSLGRETVAYITDMNQPLGEAIGNSLEVVEAIDILKGHGSERLKEIIEMLGGESLKLGGKVNTVSEGKDIIRSSIINGTGLKKFGEIVKAQGGDSKVIEDISLLPQAKFKLSVVSHLSGYLHSVQTKSLGQLANFLGAGRAKKTDKIDLSVGIVFKKKIGDTIEKGEEIALIYANDEVRGKQAALDFLKFIEIKDTQAKPLPLLYYRVSKEGVEKLFNEG